MSYVRRWLPPRSHFGGDSRTALGEVVSVWAANWFARSKLAISPHRDVGGPSKLADEALSWSSRDGEVTISVARRGWQTLLELALGRSFVFAQLTDVDRALLEGLGRRMIEDLGQLITDGIDGASGSNDSVSADGLVWTDRGVCVAVSVPGLDTLLEINLAAARLVALRLSGLQTGRGKLPLIGVAEALGSVPVELEAMIGVAQLPLTELISLSVGDVVVLDRRIASGARLSVASSGQTVAEGRLTDVDGRAALALP